MGAEIAPFTAADVPEALALWRQTEGIGLFGDSPDTIARALERSPGLSFVARDGGALVGCVLGTHDGRRGYLHHLAVARSHRGRGLGRALAERCVAAFTAAGLARCHLFVQRDNPEAAEFWRHAGWVERADVLMMSRTLREKG